MSKRHKLEIGGVAVAPGEVRDLELAVSQSYSGGDLTLPIRVQRAPAAGPTVLITGAVHGDELNGTGIIRQILLHQPFELVAGSLVLVPVVNILGFERRSRYLPDRRDLNRCFPGSTTGSLSSRVAHAFFDGVVRRCDILLDLHTGGAGRTNFPNVRADLSDPGSAKLARAFGCELLVDTQGQKGTLRRAAVLAGVPAALLEAGEVLKVESAVVELGVRGVRNVLISLGMVEGKPKAPAYQAEIARSRWVRAEVGGMMRFHIVAGDAVETGQPLATCSTLLGEVLGVLEAPEDGVILGMTTLPSVKPGDPVCHLAVPKGGIASIRRAQGKLAVDSLHQRLRGDLAAGITVDEVA